MQFVSTSLEQSLKINENLTLSEANLREEFMNVISNNTEEINIILHAHNETIQKLAEQIFILEKENIELKKKINQKAVLLEKQQRGIKQGIKVISDDEEESELDDEDTIDINKTQYAFSKNQFNRKMDYKTNTVRQIILLKHACVSQIINKKM